MARKIHYLKNIRNKIVHNGGWASPSLAMKETEEFKGIKYLVNLILIEDTGVVEVRKFADDVVDFLIYGDSLQISCGEIMAFLEK